tara:strand:+ start:216 stop:524 length:309 start_codon:yes stop_codon:yes gene_type:complete
VFSINLPWILCGVLFLSLCVSLYYNYRFATIILKIEDAIEASLNKLDQRYASISKVLEIPLFYDSPQIRQVVDDIRASRDSILEVANQIASIEETSDEEEIS